MNQSQLNRAVAQATGETVQTIEQLGFSLLSLSEPAKGRRRARRRRGRRSATTLVRRTTPGRGHCRNRRGM
jgi:hypothetical protein